MKTFYTHASATKFLQDKNSIFVLSSLASYLFAGNEHISSHAVV